MYRASLIVVTLCAALQMRAQSVPSKYQDIYNNLNSQITAFDSAVKADWDGSTYPTLYSPQLLAAGSDLYTGLLAPYYYDDVVLPQLTAIQALGANSVTVHISFPVLYQPYFVSDPTLFQQFVSFYQQLLNEVHSRGMKMVVETGITIPFAGNMADTFTSYYSGLPWDAYMTGRAQTALAVAQLIVPDYLSVITEPDTEAQYSHQTNAGTVDGSTQLLQTILSTIEGAGVSNVPIGAGTGTWMPSFTSYIQSYAATSLQYIDVHVYPVNNSDFMNALTIADTVHAAGKQLAISEAWVYKVADKELGWLGPNQLYGRDPFSFWAPIDTAFLSALVDLANAKHLAFLGPFWSHYLFAYLDYDTWGSRSSNKIMNESYTAANDANIAGTFTSTGMAWMAKTDPIHDTTAPDVPAAPVVANVFTTNVNLTWSASRDNVGVAAYRLYRDGQLLTTTSILGYNDNKLVNGETYTYTLAAFDASGNVSAQSAPLTVQTFNVTPPSVPQNVSVTSVSKNSVSLNWSASTGVGGVGGYRVLRGTSSNNLQIHATATSTTWADPYCSPSTTYYYAVESFNPNGIASDPSKTVKAKTSSK